MYIAELFVINVSEDPICFGAEQPRSQIFEHIENNILRGP